MKKLLYLKLKFFTKSIIKKYKPKVVAITGSVGKSSTKEALYSAFKNQENIRKSYKNYNNEIGVPFTVIGINTLPGKSFLNWSLIFLKALKLLIFKDKNYPKILILELAVDRPGDMKYLTSIIKPDISIVTGVSSSHLEFFKNLSHIKEEKEVLVKNTKKEGTVILNSDNPYALGMKENSQSQVLTFGLKNQADFTAQEINFNYEKASEKEEFNINNLKGINFKLKYNGSVVPIYLQETINKSTIYAVLSALAVSQILNFNILETAQALTDYQTPNGRMKLIEGIKHTVLIDDTYNSSPISSKVALETLKTIKLSVKHRKIVALGDMLELGRESKASHYEIGKILSPQFVKEIVLVGPKSWQIYQGAVDGGFKKENIYHFDDAETAGKFLQNKLEEHDVLLIKGSQGVRMEKITKELMAQPLEAKNLLVRQEASWQKK